MSDEESITFPRGRRTLSAAAHREAMWEVVGRSWQEQAARRKRRRGVRAWSGAGVGLAVALTAGVFVGRWSAGPGVGEQPAPSVIADRISVGAPLPTPYRLAVGEHFEEAETVLVLFDSAEEVDADLVVAARELAATSRMLMSSRAGRDAEVRSMLLDLELLLTQISRLVESRDPAEPTLVRDGIEESEVLSRLRRMTVEGPRRTEL